MKKINFAVIFFLLVVSNLFSQAVWKFDDAHSKIGFGVTHLVITEVDGYFSKFDGTITTQGNDFENAQVEFTADVNSINTDNEKRDEHLKSDDFFNAEKFPELKFKSTSFKKVSDSKFKLVGDLTLRDITKQITLDVKYNGTVKDPWGNTKAGFKITGELNRFDYGLKWNSLLETGGAVVGKTVELNINVELNKQK